MSYQAMAWATEQKAGSATRKAVLLALANRLNHDTGLCCPKIATISEETEVGERAVREALKALEESGLIERSRTRGDGGQLRGYIYSFPHLSKVERESTSPAAAGAARPAAAGAALNQEEELNQEHLLSGKPTRAFRNSVWDSLVHVTRAPSTRSEQSDFGKTVSELCAVIPPGATPEQIVAAMSARRQRWLLRYPGAEFTHRVFRMHWTTLGSREATAQLPEQPELEDDGTGNRTF